MPCLCAWDQGRGRCGAWAAPCRVACALVSQTNSPDLRPPGPCSNACAKEDLYYPHPLIQVRAGHQPQCCCCAPPLPQDMPFKRSATPVSPPPHHPRPRAPPPSPPPTQDLVWWTLYKCEPLLLGSRLRGRALAECMKHIHYEVGGGVGRRVGASACQARPRPAWGGVHASCQGPPRTQHVALNPQDENTRYVDIGPVNKVRPCPAQRAARGAAGSGEACACRWLRRRGAQRSPCAGLCLVVSLRLPVLPAGAQHAGLLVRGPRLPGVQAPPAAVRSWRGLHVPPEARRPAGGPLHAGALAASPHVHPPPLLHVHPHPCRPCSLFDYLWVAEDGMKMQGYNGSQLWDTAFAVQVCGCVAPRHDGPATAPGHRGSGGVLAGERERCLSCAAAALLRRRPLRPRGWRKSLRGACAGRTTTSRRARRAGGVGGDWVAPFRGCCRWLAAAAAPLPPLFDGLHASTAPPPCATRHPCGRWWRRRSSH